MFHKVPDHVRSHPNTFNGSFPEFIASNFPFLQTIRTVLFCILTCDAIPNAIENEAAFESSSARRTILLLNMELPFGTSWSKLSNEKVEHITKAKFEVYECGRYQFLIRKK